MVLDSLAGDFVDASLRLLPRGGSFLEMGKTDIRDADTVAAAHPGVRYRAFDLFEPGRPRMHEYIVELSGMFEEGILTPLPVTTWDIRRAPAALRYLSQARHIGKIVMTMPDAWTARHRADHRRHRHGRRRGRPPRRRQSRCAPTDAAVAPRTRRPRRGRAGRRADRRGRARPRCVAADAADRAELRAVLDGLDAAAVRDRSTPPACSTTPSSGR